MTSRRRVVAAGILAVSIGLLSGCGGGTDSAPSGGLTSITPSPVRSSAPDALPTGPAVQEWADSVLPPDRAGGTSAVVRDSGEVSPDLEAVIDLAQPAGSWDITIVCQSADGSPLTLTPAPVEVNALKPLACAAAADGMGGDHMSITFEGGSAGTLTLSATAPAVYAYEIRAHTAGQD